MFLPRVSVTLFPFLDCIFRLLPLLPPSPPALRIAGDALSQIFAWLVSFVVQLAVETLPSSKVSILNPLPCWSLQSFLVCFPSLSTIGWNPWTSARIGNEFAEKPRVHSSQVRREQGTVCLGLSMQVPLLCPFFRGEPPPPTERGVRVSGGVQAQPILSHPGWSRAQGMW